MHKYVQIKQYASKQPTGQRGNKKRSQKISSDKKSKYNILKFMGFNKSSLKGEVYK